MSNIVLDANDHTGLWDKSFLLLMDMDTGEIVEGLVDLSQESILVLWNIGEKKTSRLFYYTNVFLSRAC